MTPEELAAIRARDADWDAGAREMGLPDYMTPCSTDRRALLAEVDRLTTEMDGLTEVAAYNTNIAYDLAVKLRDDR